MSLSDIEAICKQYAEKHSKGGVQFVDLYGSDPARAQYKIETEVLNVNYSPSGKVIDKPDITVEEVFDNDTSLEQKQTFTKTSTTNSSFSWSVTEGIKIGTKVEVSFGLPSVAQGKVEVSTQLSFSSTQTKSWSSQQQWTCQREITVPSHKTTHAWFSIVSKEYDIDFTADIAISGNFAFWSTQKIDLNNEESGTDLHWLWYPCITQALREFPQPNYRIDGDKVIFTARGKFTGAQGILSKFRVCEVPLGAPAVPKSLLSTDENDSAVDEQVEIIERN